MGSQPDKELTHVDTGHEEDPDRLADEVRQTRGHLDELVGDLNRRRREAMDLKLQARRHPRAALAVVAAPVVLGTIFLLLRRRRSRQPDEMPWQQNDGGRQAPHMAARVATAAATAAVGVLARRLARRAADQVLPETQPTP